MKTNEQYNNRIKEILKQYKFHYFRILSHKENSDLLEYIENWDEKVKVFSLGTKIFWVLHNKHDYSYCKKCGKPLLINMSPHSEEYPTYCSNECSTHDPDRNAKIVNTNLKRYGCKAPAQNKLVLEKMKQTNLEKYGVEYSWQDEKVKEKIKESCLEKYGVECASRSELIKEKSRQTCLKKYGTINGGCSKEALEKIKNTCLERYGVESSWKIEGVKEKSIKTMNEKYGVDYFTQTKEFKEKSQETNKKRYGTKHPPSWTYVYQGISFDSSWELALYIWLKDNNVAFEFHPDKHFVYVDKDGVSRKYRPDFKIKDQYVELKGALFFKDKDITKEMICPFNRKHDYIYEAKHQCMIKNGVVIFSNKEMEQYLNYIEEKYGVDYLSQFKNKEWVHKRKAKG